MDESNPEDVGANVTVENLKEETIDDKEETSHQTTPSQTPTPNDDSLQEKTPSENSHNWKRAKPRKEAMPSVLVDQWMHHLHRCPLDARLFPVPGKIPVDLACEMLRKDPHVSNVLGVYTMNFYARDADTSAEKIESTPDNEKPFCYMLAIVRPNGYGCSFNIDRLGGVPRQLRLLLFDPNIEYIGYDFSSGLANIDQNFKGRTVDIDIFSTVRFINEYDVLPGIFSKVGPNLSKVATQLFQCEDTVVRLIGGEDHTISSIYYALLVLDIYAYLELHYDKLSAVASKIDGIRLFPLKNPHIWRQPDMIAGPSGAPPPPQQ